MTGNGSVTIRNGYDSKYDKYMISMKRDGDDTWITSYFSKDQYNHFAKMMLRLIETHKANKK
jgi:hypothetical protein